ncbi:MAG TPA: phosphoribosylformylglycinamidine synthase subunit PurQ [Thermodesulfobacteriota bacterium]|nr:phosphoribosylformylglycinamidine synthase subunit PurQ [Thermodesulfobacteriota bacterium]
MMDSPRALVLTGYGLNCDLETQYALSLAGFAAERVHITELLESASNGKGKKLEQFHFLVFDGGFSWGDDHGAGVLLATRLKHKLKADLESFIAAGKLIIGICNGFQAMVNMGLLPGFDGRYDLREVALLANDCGNFRDDWVRLKVHPESTCIFTRGMDSLDLPVRHGEGKFYAPQEVLDRLCQQNQVALTYALPSGETARGQFPENPNGSLKDIAGICDTTGRIFGLMPHPEAFHHFTQHPDWTFQKELKRREGKSFETEEGAGLKFFQNAYAFLAKGL